MIKYRTPAEARRFIIEKIEEKSFFEPNTGCQIWCGRTLSGDERFKRLAYGALTLYKRSFPAHRVSFSLFKGTIPDGMFVLHKCDNPTCINPDHLFLGTKRDNILDAISKGRAPARSAKGHKLNHGNVCKRAKVNDEKVRIIRKMHEMGFNQTIIARFFRVRPCTVSAIITKRAWFYVSD